MFSNLLQTIEFDPYESTYIGDYKNPNKLQSLQERKYRIERAVGTQCSPASFILSYEDAIDRTTLRIRHQADIFVTTNPPVAAPLHGVYPPGVKYIKLRYGRPRDEDMLRQRMGDTPLLDDEKEAEDTEETKSDDAESSRLKPVIPEDMTVPKLTIIPNIPNRCGHHANCCDDSCEKCAKVAVIPNKKTKNKNSGSEN